MNSTIIEQEAMLTRAQFAARLKSQWGVLSPGASQTSRAVNFVWQKLSEAGITRYIARFAEDVPADNPLDVRILFEVEGVKFRMRWVGHNLWRLDYSGDAWRGNKQTVWLFVNDESGRNAAAAGDPDYFWEISEQFLTAVSEAIRPADQNRLP